MKTTMKKIALVLLALTFVLSLSSCAMGGDLKSAYEAAGYQVTETVEENCKLLVIEKVEGEGDDMVTHAVAMIVEFPSVEEMKNIIPQKELEEAEKACNIRENAVFIANPEDEALSAEAKTIFEKYVVFQPLAFVTNLRYIGWGMLGIFVVIGLIVITTVVLNRATAAKK